MIELATILATILADGVYVGGGVLLLIVVVIILYLLLRRP